MGFRSLLELSDKAARKELGNYYVISESRMDNYIFCLEDGAKRIRHLEEENTKLRKQVIELEESLEDYRFKENL